MNIVEMLQTTKMKVLIVRRIIPLIIQTNIAIRVISNPDVFFSFPCVYVALGNL